MICVPIREKTINKTAKCLIKAQKRGDCVELWFDSIKENLNDNDLKKIFSHKNKPIIYKWENNKNNLKNILRYNPEYIDVDIKTGNDIIKEIRRLSPKTKIIISFHDFKKTPDEKSLIKIKNKMLKKSADTVKIACYANKFTDSLIMLAFLEKLHKKDVKAICLCMGEKGKVTRLTGHLFGNYLMYAPVEKTDSTALGQITAGELKDILRLTKRA